MGEQIVQRVLLFLFGSLLPTTALAAAEPADLQPTGPFQLHPAQSADDQILA